MLYSTLHISFGATNNILPMYGWVRSGAVLKLLTPEVGWAADPQRLFWTTDGGGDWKDITPKKPVVEEEIASAFFLDTSTG